MNAQTLKLCLIALYGERGWQKKAALAFSVDVSTIRRWISAQVPVPGPVSVLVALLMAQEDDLED